MNDVVEQIAARDRDIGEKILKLKQVGVLALDTAISAFAARNISKLEITELTEKVMRMSELLEEIGFGIHEDWN